MSFQKKAPVFVEVGQKFPLTIHRLGINGEGIGYYKHKIVFVPQALPGEVITAKVTEVSPKFIRAKVQRLRERSKDRVKPADPLYGKVGGLELAHLSYPAQLRFKRDVVIQALEKFQPQGYAHYDIRQTIGGEPTKYRNKAQFPLQQKDKQLIAGLYEAGTHHLVDATEISTQMPQVNAVLQKLTALLQSEKVPIYDEKKAATGIRTLVVRASATTGEIQVTLIVADPKLVRDTMLFVKIREQIPEITACFVNVNTQKTSVIWGSETHYIFGTKTIQEKIDDKVFQLSPQAFFQLNPAQTQKLYGLAKAAFHFKGTETLIDAYCGVGTLGITMADQVAQVRGMDIVPQGIADAQENAALNHVDNCHYEVGAAEQLIPQWLEDGVSMDALIVDPPRTGLTKGLAEAIVSAQPKQFVYISCNPSTLARDLVILSKKYQVNYIQSIDMFPQTARCEALVKLTRK